MTILGKGEIFGSWLLKRRESDEFVVLTLKIMKLESNLAAC